LLASRSGDSYTFTFEDAVTTVAGTSEDSAHDIATVRVAVFAASAVEPVVTPVDMVTEQRVLAGSPAVWTRSRSCAVAVPELVATVSNAVEPQPVVVVVNGAERVNVGSFIKMSSVTTSGMLVMNTNDKEAAVDVTGAYTVCVTWFEIESAL
jgi:hypothetical protein